jgi:hypothetical protein
LIATEPFGSPLRRAVGRAVVAFLNKDKKYSASIDCVRILTGFLNAPKESSRMYDYPFLSSNLFYLFSFFFLLFCPFYFFFFLVRNAIGCLGVVFRYKAKNLLSIISETMNTLAKFATSGKDV